MLFVFVLSLDFDERRPSLSLLGGQVYCGHRPIAFDSEVVQSLT